MTEMPETVFVTKYALTSGIKEVSGSVSRASPSMFVAESRHGVAAYYHGEGKDWHTTREAAVSRANQMRDAKLTSLEKQVERLRGMRF